MEVLGEKTALEVVELVPTILGSKKGRGLRGSIVQFHGDGVPTGGPMAVDGGGEQKVLQRAPWFGVGLALVNHVSSFSHVIIGISNLGFMATELKIKNEKEIQKASFSSFLLYRDFILVVGCVFV